MNRLRAIFILLGVFSLFILSGCGISGTGGNGKGDVANTPASVISSSSNSLTTFSLSTTAGTIGNAGIINGNVITVAMPHGTDLSSLIATFETNAIASIVSVGKITQTSGVTVNNFQTPLTYTVTWADGSITTYVVIVTTALESDKAITAYSLSNNDGIYLGHITGQNITVTVPYKTDVRALIATYTSSGADTSVNGQSQANGVTSNDFTNKVTYTVTAADGSTAEYNVIVQVASSTDKAITSYSINNIAGTISGSNISLTVPYGTNLTSLVATFITSGVDVSVNSQSQFSAYTPNNFLQPVTYTVTAADGSTATYQVTINEAQDTNKDLTSFTLYGVPGVFSGSNITITLPYSVDRNGLIATFTTNGTGVFIDKTQQISDSTPNDFSNPLIYIVTAADGSSAKYTVTVKGPDSLYAYTSAAGGDGWGEVHKYLFNENTGILTALNGQPSGAEPSWMTKPTFVAFDRSGRYAYVVDRYYNLVRTFSVDPTSGDFTYLSVATTNESPLSIIFNPSGKFAYVNSATAQKTSVYSVDSSNGALTPTELSYIDYNHVTFNKPGTFAYMIDGSSNKINIYSVDSHTGELILATTISNKGQLVNINISPSGKYAYVSTSNSIIQYSIDNMTGELTELDSISTTTGPTAIAFAPSGQYAYVADDSNLVSTYTINVATGKFSPSGTVTFPFPIGSAGDDVTFLSGSLTFSPSGQYMYAANGYGMDIYMYRVNSNGQITEFLGQTEGLFDQLSSMAFLK